MRTIKITRKVKELLDDYSDDDESYDALINRLLDEVDMSNRVEVQGYANIGVSDDTLMRLQELKLSDKDSYTKLLSDALSFLG